MGLLMNENTDKIMASEDMFNHYLELKKEKAKLDSQKTKIELEKKEIEELKNSVEYLKTVYEHSKLQEQIENASKVDEESLKVHLYAAKFQVSQLKDKLDMLNGLLSISPYVYALLNLEEMTFEWVSENISLFGYDHHALRHSKVDEVLLDSDEKLCVKDGFILNHTLKKADGELTWVDLHFNLDLSVEKQVTLITFHEVKERYKSD